MKCNVFEGFQDLTDKCFVKLYGRECVFPERQPADEGLLCMCVCVSYVHGSS